MAANQMKNRMQSLGLLDRSFKAATDDELSQAAAGLGDEHRDALEQFVEATDGEFTADALRDGVRAGRIDGGMEAIATILSDACLADCIEQLGDHADNPSSDQLREVLPGVVERHNVGVTRIMLAATVAGEAPASAIIRDLLKNDELVALPKVEDVDIAPIAPASTARRSEDEQAELRAKRKAAKAAKKDAERARKAQSAAAKRR